MSDKDRAKQQGKRYLRCLFKVVRGKRLRSGNKSNFFAELKTKGLFANSGTVDGKTVKNIVKGYTVETEFIEYRGQESLPFD